MANSALGLDLGDGCVPARIRCGDQQGQEAASPLNFAASLRLVSIMPPASPAVDEWYYVGTRASGRSLKAEANFRFGSQPEVSDGHENVRFRGYCALESA